MTLAEPGPSPLAMPSLGSPPLAAPQPQDPPLAPILPEVTSRGAAFRQTLLHWAALVVMMTAIIGAGWLVSP